MRPARTASGIATSSCPLTMVSPTALPAAIEVSAEEASSAVVTCCPLRGCR
ncbi:hypothetical protein ACFPRL_15175 [Pseudoclavibacter helvolus]